MSSIDRERALELLKPGRRGQRLVFYKVGFNWFISRHLSLLQLAMNSSTKRQLSYIES
jgi:hypothetical protein